MNKIAFSMVWLLWAPLALALAPYIEGDRVLGGDLGRAMQDVENRLGAAGFKPVGRFTPQGLAGYGVVVVTEEGVLDAIRRIGGASIVGAGLRVGVKEDGTVSYINPGYWYRAYLGDDFHRHQSAVKEVEERLKQALGSRGYFGGDVAAERLPHYRYSFGLERFKDSLLLKQYPSFDAAIKTIENNLRQGVKSTSLAYKVILAEQQLAVFGVSAQDPQTGDAMWVSRLVPDHIAALPYELYVVGNQAFALHPRFRISFAWPALGMGAFLKIGSTPTEVLATLAAVAGGAYKPRDEWGGEQGWY